MFKILTLSLLIALLHSTSYADQVFNEDVIVNGSMCVGSECESVEAFDFDTFRFKSDDPQVSFQDTSSSASFPTNDWSMGFTDEGSTVTPYFYITDEDQGSVLLMLQSGTDGGVAIGADSTIEDNAISVGSTSNTRRIMFVEDGVDDSDVATMAQFNAFTSTAENNVAVDIADIDADLVALQTSLDELTSRLNDLANRLNVLEP